MKINVTVCVALICATALICTGHGGVLVGIALVIFFIFLLFLL